jgi:hypothetical protein
MISTQDLASDKENLDPTEESPNEKSPDWNMPASNQSNKTKRRHNDAFLDDEDQENEKPRTKQVRRSPLVELSSLKSTLSRPELYCESCLPQNLQNIADPP